MYKETVCLPIIELKKGDIVWFRSGNYLEIEDIEGNVFFEDIVKVERPYFETIYEAPKEILTEKEKEYLEAVLKPFKAEVSHVIKLQNRKKDEEHLWVDLKNGGSLRFPWFKASEHYKGMELNKEYSLNDLHLFKEEE